MNVHDCLQAVEVAENALQQIQRKIDDHDYSETDPPDDEQRTRLGVASKCIEKSKDELKLVGVQLAEIQRTDCMEPDNSNHV